MKLALEQRITDDLSAGGLFNPELADHLAVRDLLIDCRKALAEPDFWAGYVPEPDGTCSNTLRIQGKAYPRTCKKCGLGPCVELAQQALDKKAENARELGLDYEPAQQEPVATCPQDIIHAITLYGDARADQDANNAPTTSHERLADCIRLVRKALAAPVQQEPVAFLANGTRFKISYDSRQSGGQIHGIPPELGGRWVAFVAADDDCHLKLTSPPAQRKPLPDFSPIFGDIKEKNT